MTEPWGLREYHMTEPWGIFPQHREPEFWSRILSHMEQLAKPAETVVCVIQGSCTVVA